MESSGARRVLVVANRTAGTGVLLDEVERRSAEHCRFTLLIPDAADRKAADWTLETALPLLTKAAGRKVEGLVSGPDPLDAITKVVREQQFDEIIISTFSRRTSKWLRRDLPRQVKALGLPVSVVTPEKEFIPSYLPSHMVKDGPYYGGGPG
jgi:hypothetical protein